MNIVRLEKVLVRKRPNPSSILGIMAGKGEGIMGAYETIMFWISLYPHEIGDELLNEIVKEG